MIPLHGIATRDDLPLPFELVVGGAALVLVVTFWIIAFAWREPLYEQEGGRPLPRLSRLVDSPWFSRTLRLLAIVMWTLAGGALFFGPDRLDNPVFGFVFVLLWVGLVPVALLFGRSYERTNPLRAVLFRRGGTSPEPGSQASLWPAAVALLVFSYAELVETSTLTLPVLRGFAVAWVAWVLVGALVSGPGWIARADPFESFASTIARLSPWTRDAAGTLALTHPLRNLASWRVPRHLALLCSVLLGGTLFDAASASSWWVRATQDLPVDRRIPGTLGLLATVAIVYALFLLCCVPLRRRRSLSATADALAPGLVPLIAGYFVAHYLTLLYLEGQRTLIRFSDPLGLGWNLFGMAEMAPGTMLLAFPWLIAGLQVLIIVAGHVVGAVVTHDIALRGGDSQSAVRAQVPLLLLMVCLTVGGMLLMFGE